MILAGQGTVRLDIAVDTTTLKQKACERSMVSVGWGERGRKGEEDHEGVRRKRDSGCCFVCWIHLILLRRCTLHDMKKG